MSDKQPAVQQAQNSLATRQAYTLAPTTFDEMMQACNFVAKSSMIPERYQDKPSDIFVAASLGMELGLSFLQSLQGVMVIGKLPTVWGDHALAIVRSSGLLEDFSETYDESTETATCTMKRRGQETPIVRTFSMADAENAGLAKKTGPWQGYWKRMCQMRARSWAMRDGFSDVLRGIRIAEEVSDYATSDGSVVTAEEIERVADDIPMPRATTGVAAAALAKPEPEQKKARAPRGPKAEAAKDAVVETTATVVNGTPAPEPAPALQTATVEPEPEAEPETAHDNPQPMSPQAEEPEPEPAVEAEPAEHVPTQRQAALGAYDAMRVGKVTRVKDGDKAVFRIYLLDDSDAEMVLCTTEQPMAESAARAKRDSKTVGVMFVPHPNWGWELNMITVND